MSRILQKPEIRKFSLRYIIAVRVHVQPTFVAKAIEKDPPKEGVIDRFPIDLTSISTRFARYRQHFQPVPPQIAPI